MFKNVSFHFNHVIESNQDAYSRRAKFFLSPARQLVSLYGNRKTIRYFNVRNESGKIQENHSLGPLLKKIPIIACYILFVLPGLLIGGCLMKLALRNKDVQRSFSLLKKWLPNDKGYDAREILPIPNELFNQILFFVSEKGKINFRSVSQSAKAMMDNGYLAAIDRKLLKGITKETNGDNSIMNLTSDCYEYQKKYRYTEPVIQVFGGFKNILKLPLVASKKDPTRKNEDLFSEIDSLAQSPAFAKYPNIFRYLSSTFGKNKDEWIIIKYTLLIPNQMSIDSQEHAWHDYLIWRPSKLVEKSPPVVDARSEDQIQKERGENSFSKTLRKDISYEMKVNWCRSIISWLDIPMALKQSNELINKKEIPFRYLNEDRYETTLCKLGHITLQEMRKTQL